MADQEDLISDLSPDLTSALTSAPSPDLAPAHASHRTTTVEKGRFMSAQCSCGWRGPARRARSKARTDAAEHEESP
ncbi:hypothetical protein JQK87_23960 [Streptomyces sp. G44]|uniref:hypothetical protein n=1 Tax=Streptomyces sp. G44 TaxID=2807632 RepID=UPI00195F3066|nr:hypothetical protein [Streptomyces sp. G44]MBM7171405.1 hypothetical protein [Streptomyces sp. G44]